MSTALVHHLHFPPFHFPEAYQGGNAWPNDQNALKGVEGGDIMMDMDADRVTIYVKKS